MNKNNLENLIKNCAVSIIEEVEPCLKAEYFEPIEARAVNYMDEVDSCLDNANIVLSPEEKSDCYKFVLGMIEEHFGSENCYTGQDAWKLFGDYQLVVRKNGGQ